MSQYKQYRLYLGGGFEAWALRLLGEVASHHDRPDVATAEAHYGAAMTLASETGKHEQAQEHLAIATTLYREMDMRFWLEQAEAESKVS